MFITVLHGDNQRSLFNTQCKTVVLLDWIKVKCGCRREAEIDLANLNGQMMNLPHHQSAVASDVLGQREEYILVSMSRTGDPSNPVYTPLLHNYHLPDPQCLEEGRLNRTLTSSVSNESQPKPHKQIRFSSASTFQVYPV
ncbi:uncharacterized protein CXorf65-like isoform X2 [Hemibagrus wyckioides]|uniref:uncharacterized protein CXorf65-like isoform X2 n=1 Tax=Hemibagrus wyckioides TaxID=337641 RepID=UPI00266CA789|nr:uncharacterized protein CXorf65-like isoform X2 [Hemibagrus wyckioides]